MLSVRKNNNPPLRDEQKWKSCKWLLSKSSETGEQRYWVFLPVQRNCVSCVPTSVIIFLLNIVLKWKVKIIACNQPIDLSIDKWSHCSGPQYHCSRMAGKAWIGGHCLHSIHSRIIWDLWVSSKSSHDDHEIDEILGLRHYHGWIQSGTAATAKTRSARTEYLRGTVCHGHFDHQQVQNYFIS